MNEMNNSESINENQPETVSTPGVDMGRGFGNTLGNMRFMGRATIAWGILSCFSIFGMVVGIPMIIAANKLLNSVRIFESFTMSADQRDLREGFEELGSSFGILKIMIIISFLLAAMQIVLFFVVGGIGLIGAFSEMG